MKAQRGIIPGSFFSISDPCINPPLFPQPRPEHRMIYWEGLAAATAQAQTLWELQTH